MFKHILLATDGSHSAEHAAKKTFELARIHGGQVTAAFVVDPYPYIGLGDANPMAFQSYMAAAQEAAAKAFTHLSDLAAAAGIRLEVRLVEDAHAVDGILAMADEAALDPMPLPGAIFSRIVISTCTGFPYASSMAATAGVMTLSSGFSGSLFPLSLRIASPLAPASAATSIRSPTPSSVRPMMSKPQPRFATVPGAKTLICFMVNVL
mgnify:CR=1 FL=1